MNLTGKVTLVTGASRGIGRQIALTLAGYGATVIVNYNGSAAKAEEVVNEITANGGMAESMQCSVSDFEKSKEMIDGIVKKYGRLDILVNNAGITKDNLIMKMSEDDFDAVIATNLKGAFNCIKHVSRQMLKQRGGRIINISSVSGVMGNAGQANYCASHRTHEIRCERAWKPRNHIERSRTGIYPYRDDGCAAGGRKESHGRADSVKAFRRDKRHCGGSRISRFR